MREVIKLKKIPFDMVNFDQNRGSLEVPRREIELENQELDATDEEQLLEYECSLAADRRANCCRFVALTVSYICMIYMVQTQFRPNKLCLLVE